MKQKRLAKTALIPCVVRDPSVDISAEEDSLAENIHRVALHPLDQFRAFQALRENGQSEEEIAAAFFVGVNVVKQRLRLAAVSGNLLNIYAEDGMSLDQLMAFTVTNDHARQEQVWEALQRSYSQEPYQIRRLLTERTARASDKRALFVGLEAYEQAGGVILRDLFQQDDGGWLENVGLLDGLVAENLKAEAEKIAAEGWKWIEVDVDFPYGHTHHLRELEGALTDLTAEEQATIETLNAEYAKLEAEYENADELPDEVDARLGEIETALANGRPDARATGFRPMRCASVEKTSIGLPGCFAASSAGASASFMGWPAGSAGGVIVAGVTKGERSQMQISGLGKDLGKNSCSLVGLDGEGTVVKRRACGRRASLVFTKGLPPCIIAMEACCGAHHLRRLLEAEGHEVRLMSPEL